MHFPGFITDIFFKIIYSTGGKIMYLTVCYIPASSAVIKLFYDFFFFEKQNVMENRKKKKDFFF